MSLDTALSTALGALISLVLFGISYRQTVGARRERIRTANSEMQRTLIKRFVLDINDLAPKDLERYIEGKAREHQVRSAALLSRGELLANVYAQVFDDDLIDSGKRSETASAISAMLDRLEQEPSGEALVASEEVSLERRRRLLLGVLGATTAMIGSLAALLPAVGREVNGGAYAAALAASLAAIAAVLAVLRLREGDNPESSRESALQSAARLERDVEKIIRRYGGCGIAGPDRGLDFLVPEDKPRVGIELKAWQRPLPHSLLIRMIERADAAGRKAGVSEVLLVTPRPNLLPPMDIDNDFVQVVGLSELDEVLKRRLQ